MERREDRTLEFKESVSRSFLKTVSAFANYETGRIIFGVDDDGEIKGLADPLGDALRIENMINDSLDPVPDFSLEPSRKDGTVTLKVWEGEAKPYLYCGKAYRRTDSSTVPVDQVQLKRLVLAGENLTFDELKSSDQALTFRKLTRAFAERAGVEDLGSDALRTLGLMDKDAIYSNAGAILADKNSFPGIDLVRFGRDENEFLHRETHEGVSAIELLERAEHLFHMFYERERVEGGDREKVFLVPPDAYREAIANALVHRTWDTSANIRVGMHDDRIEIMSPGGLPPDLTEDEYLNGQVSSLRNPLIATVFFRLRYIEKFGTGILRIKRLYQKWDISPSFGIGADSVGVNLPVLRELPVSSRESRVLKALGNALLLTRTEIASLTGLSPAQTLRTLNVLEKQGLVVRQGKARGTKYRRC